MYINYSPTLKQAIFLGKFCIAYLLLSQSFKPLKVILFLKPSHLHNSHNWEFLRIPIPRKLGIQFARGCALKSD